ncbi:MAG: septal ring lytic transglycosylase RlpA family protein [Aquamicrobium sp.]|uniref:septal ring lytic transglycosylase RlpA family protein n=1 Tax=Aquamicrobium sp. TaxID=1872579 RepID=UPI00349EAA84|nr:septal ring lytic transglycosylase RlpA family protein [Aquamicrobium sp.]
MRIAPFRLTGRGTGLLVMSISVLALAACSTPSPKVAGGKTRSKEYFSEREYGVKASPRVSNLRTRLPRGGGREQVGKPYMVKGKWYHPKEEPGYRKTGVASWYGDAFHGRLTANGEIYDMTHLTAAHPTMPLPSYARVTNTKNGNSVIVRVNDRGPFAHGRVIDLSRRAAELLDYTHSGVAKVEVEYVGRAPLHGRDDEFLVASYRPGGRAPDPSDGMPSGVMIAMNGPTPTQAVAAGAGIPFPIQPRAAVPFEVASVDLVLPDFGPYVPERPVSLASKGGRVSSPALSYADARVQQAAQAVTDFADPGTDALVAALNRRYADAAKAAPASSAGYVAVGTYADEAEAQALAARLGEAGRVEIETDWRGEAFTLNLHPASGRSLDDALQAAWAAGAADAMPVRE